MRAVRLFHAITVMLAGSAIAVAFFRHARLAAVFLAIATILLAWSFEIMRAAITRPENRP